MDKKKKKIQSGTIQLQLAGSLLMAKSPDKDVASLFRRYETLLENLANMEKEERIINYKFLIGLALTSHAKKSVEITKKKEIFNLKNNLYLNIANNQNYRSKLKFLYLLTKNFRILEFCGKCEELNQKEQLARHQWKFCNDCKIDRKFFNILSMHHKFKNGSTTLFLSNDMVDEVKNIKNLGKGKLEDYGEEARFNKYQYNVRNMDVFSFDSVVKTYEKLLEM